MYIFDNDCAIIVKLLPFQGVGLYVINTQGVALGYELLPFQGVWGIHTKLEGITNPPVFIDRTFLKREEVSILALHFLSSTIMDSQVILHCKHISSLLRKLQATRWQQIEVLHHPR